MQHIIFSTKYYCELCKRELVLHLYGEDESLITKEDEPEVIEWARHYHWIDNHRVCAICGKIVKSNELELMVNDGKVVIHEDYTDEYKKVQKGERFGSMLIVHEDCINKINIPKNV